MKGSGTRGVGRGVKGGWKRDGRRGRSGNTGTAFGQGLGQERAFGRLTVIVCVGESVLGTVLVDGLSGVGKVESL